MASCYMSFSLFYCAQLHTVIVRDAFFSVSFCTFLVKLGWGHGFGSNGAFVYVFTFSLPLNFMHILFSFIWGGFGKFI